MDPIQANDKNTEVKKMKSAQTIITTTTTKIHRNTKKKKPNLAKRKTNQRQQCGAVTSHWLTT